MGHHAGMVAARASWSALEARLVDRVRLEVGPKIGSMDDVDDRGQSIGGELDGRAYVHDAEMILSSDGDLIAALSQDLETLVVGCGAETVSGSCWLFAAERGEPLRTYWACATDLREPLDIGAWPPGERIDLEDVDASGIRDVLAAGGFDFDAFIERGSKRRIEVPEDVDLGKGSIAAQVEAHRAANKIPAGQQPQPQVVGRGVEGGAPRPGLLGRVGRWFRGG